jgi:hypothetical protein
MALMGLALHLSSGVAVDPQEAMAWFGSEEGRRFVTLSSEGWYEANVAAGEAEPGDEGRRAPGDRGLHRGGAGGRRTGALRRSRRSLRAPRPTLPLRR